MGSRRRARASRLKPLPVRFDQAYYERFYVDPTTRIYDQTRHAGLVRGVVSLIEWFTGTLTSVLDIGAGLGWWRTWLSEHRPKIRVVSTELEPEICAAHGHLQADVRTLALDEHFDLVVCQGVLPYLDDAGAERALKNLATVCGGFLYLEAVTREDLRGAVDMSLTDLRVHQRTGAWYRKRLAPHFKEIGAGLFASRGSGLVFYSLEAQR